VAPIHEGALRVFKVYDETRQTADWTSLVGATQCAVFLKNVKTANPLATDGREIDHLRIARFYFSTIWKRPVPSVRLTSRAYRAEPAEPQ